MVGAKYNPIRAGSGRLRADASPDNRPRRPKSPWPFRWSAERRRAALNRTRGQFFPAFLSRLASFFSLGVLLGAFLTFFFASWLLPMSVSPWLKVIVFRTITSWLPRSRSVL